MKSWYTMVQVISVFMHEIKGTARQTKDITKQRRKKQSEQN